MVNIREKMDHVKGLLMLTSQFIIWPTVVQNVWQKDVAIWSEFPRVTVILVKVNKSILIASDTIVLQLQQ